MARRTPAAAAALTLTIGAGPAVAAGPWSEPVATPTIAAGVPVSATVSDGGHALVAVRNGNRLYVHERLRERGVRPSAGAGHPRGPITDVGLALGPDGAGLAVWTAGQSLDREGRTLAA